MENIYVLKKNSIKVVKVVYLVYGSFLTHISNDCFHLKALYGAPLMLTGGQICLFTS